MNGAGRGRPAFGMQILCNVPNLVNIPVQDVGNLVYSLSNETLFRIVVQFLQSSHDLLHTCIDLHLLPNEFRHKLSWPTQPCRQGKTAATASGVARSSASGSPDEALHTASCFHLVRHLLFESPWGPFSKLVSRHQDMSSYLRRTRMHHMHHTLRTQSPLRALKSQAWAPVSSKRYQIGFQRSRMIQKGEEMNNEWEIKMIRTEEQETTFITFPLSSHFHPLIVEHRWVCQQFVALGIRARAAGCGASCGIQVPRHGWVIRREWDGNQKQFVN